MIHEDKRDDGTPIFSASSHGAWLPGLYATRQAANYAFRFYNAALHDLWWRADLWEWKDGLRVPDSRPPITMDELRALMAPKKEAKG